MHKLIKPKKLNPGDTVAAISISAGRAGDLPDASLQFHRDGSK